jgi:type IV secretion system protein VirB9
MKSRVAVIAMLTVLAVGQNALAQPTREVTYNPRSVIRIDAHLRMTTLVVLPETEEILDFVCGDKDYWVISGAQNLAYLKPAKSGATTNLNLVTASGHVYSFLLVEGSADPDLKVYVLPDANATPTARTTPRTTTAAEIEAIKKEAAAARDEAERARRDAEDVKRTAERNAQDTIDRFKAGYPAQLRFPYVFNARTKPFKVTAIYHDGRFTYIRVEGRELPAVYEVVDHVPNLVGYQVDHDLLIVSKILDRGYLAIGKQVLPFEATAR